MKWWRWLRKPCPDPDLDERVRQARAEHDEVQAMRLETERLAPKMQRRLDENHFAERITAALAARKREA